MAVRFNAPPGWPAPSASWAPTDDWMPDPSWPAPPADWQFWTLVDALADAEQHAATSATPRFGMPPRTTVATYGTDRGSWLSGLRERAADRAAAPSRADADADASARSRVAEPAWQVDGVLAPASR